ncbi:MAG: GNAT family N-acetyltransferase [Achromobacter sp.]|uniref:GNAT family N-acetyltransferase n=1 Tax=Achromobacter TaxID=222 RepID=UPI0009E9B259|nr:MULTISPECIES: GNAT family N-acetyltransferase [Achromobacter]MBN9640737.1 GNAT family N-acetyltransferase [Achromobacter sp.]
MLTVRNATIGDATMLYEWRNDPATRFSSRNSDQILLESHIAWLTATLANPVRQLLIAEINGVPVGTVRVDEELSGNAELSWTVAPSARGRGIAKKMVRLVADQVSETLSLRAEVKAGNESSIKVALAANMQLMREVDGVLHFFRPSSRLPKIL